MGDIMAVSHYSARWPSNGARWPSGLERWTGDRAVRIPLRKTFRFGTLAIPFTPLCQCLSEETLKAVGPFYLVSMPDSVLPRRFWVGAAPSPPDCAPTCPGF